MLEENMKRHKKLILLGCSIILLAIVLLILRINYRSNTSEREKIAVVVNGVPIYCYEIERTIDLYPEDTLSYELTLNAAIREELVVQQSVEMGFSISEEELERKIEEYKKSFPKIFEDIVAQYESYDEFQQSYLYLIKYDYVSEIKRDEYNNITPTGESFEEFFENWIDLLEENADIDYYE